MPLREKKYFCDGIMAFTIYWKMGAGKVTDYVKK
jgi:hypothetical protein